MNKDGCHCVAQRRAVRLFLVESHQEHSSEFNILRDHYQSARNISWLDYLDTRYINKHH